MSYLIDLMLMEESLKWDELVWENVSWQSLRLERSKVWEGVLRSEKREGFDILFLLNNVWRCISVIYTERHFYKKNCIALTLYSGTNMFEMRPKMHFRIQWIILIFYESGEIITKVALSNSLIFIVYWAYTSGSQWLLMIWNGD